MKKALFFAMLMSMASLCLQAARQTKPWDNGRLTVSANNQYLVHENGTPFFWMGNTAWLLPERLNRDEVEFFLDTEKQQGYNVEQVQVINAGYPTFNIYGQQANDSTFDFTLYTRPGVYGYWDHMDYIVDMAAQRGIYIAMDCIWGNHHRMMTPEKATLYGHFLAQRYKDCPNIIWLIGGDIMGDRGMESWDALARAIKAEDTNHLMTFHPRGRTTSAWWYNDREWLDFNMFQSGHRRYGQRNGDGDYTIRDNTEEDNWRFVAMSFGDPAEQIQGREVRGGRKPVIDGEPSYEDIPQGLHDFTAPRWQDYDVRRYAYWSVFAGSFGHTYGHNSIMQFAKPGAQASYDAKKPWWEALNDPGYQQMKYLKRLMLSVPFIEGQNDQAIIVSQNGERYDRIIATRGQDYLMVYNYSGKPMTIDLTKISGRKKLVWLMNPANGTLQFLGEYDSSRAVEFSFDGAYLRGSDRVLIAIDSSKTYFAKDQAQLLPKD